MNVTYENGVLYLIDGNGIRILRQPTWPDGTPWADEFEAQYWGAAYILWLTDETENTPEPPTGPNQ